MLFKVNQKKAAINDYRIDIIDCEFDIRYLLSLIRLQIFYIISQILLHNVVDVFDLIIRFEVISDKHFDFDIQSLT